MDYDTTIYTLRFIKKSTKHFNIDHNHIHAHDVLIWTRLIIQNMKKRYVFILDTQHEIITELVALFHDVRDHKFKDKCISDEELRNFLFDLCEKIRLSQIIQNKKYVVDMVMKLIDMVSLSGEREKRYNLDKLNKKELYIRNIVSDADKIDALGWYGVLRCFIYTRFTKHAGKKLSPKTSLKNAIKHMENHLLQLYPKGYIRTYEGKKIARVKHFEMLEYVNFIKNYQFSKISHRN